MCDGCKLSSATSPILGQTLGIGSLFSRTGHETCQANFLQDHTCAGHMWIPRRVGMGMGMGPVRNGSRIGRGFLLRRWIVGLVLDVPASELAAILLDTTI